METMTTAPTVRFDPAGQDFASHAYEHYAELREQSPVHRLLQPDGTEVWLITRYDDVRAALADPRLSRDPRPALRALAEARPVSPDEAAGTSAPPSYLGLAAAHLMVSDPPEHTRLRRLTGPAFTARRIGRLRPRIEALTRQLLDRMAEQEQVELLSAFAFPLPIAAIYELVGVPVSDRALIRRWAGLMQSTDRELVQLWEQTFAQYASELVQATASRIRLDLPADEQPDMLHALLVPTEDGERLSQDEIAEILVLLLNAGHETTANLIGNGVLALLGQPGQRELLRRRPELLPNAVEELVRYDGPAERATFRFSLEPLTVGGVTIPAHRTVGVVIASADRDPQQFEDPDRLDVARPRPQHLGFGHGIHFCVGAPLARLVGEIAFGGLLSRFPDIELACPVEDLRYRAAGYQLRGLRALPVRPHGRPRNN